jgi:hypothetical protein
MIQEPTISKDKLHLSASNLFNADADAIHQETSHSSLETFDSSQTNLSTLSTPETNPSGETDLYFPSTPSTDQHCIQKIPDLTIPDITIHPCNFENVNGPIKETQESENPKAVPHQVPTFLLETFPSSLDESRARSGRTRVSSLSSVTFSQNYSTFHHENELEDPQHFQSLEMESEIQSRKQDAEKNEAQILAAKRSMLTNFILGSIFFVFVLSILAASPTWRPVCYAFVFLFMKIALPVFTTIANFGKVQFVLMQYWNSIQGNNLCCLNE